MDYPLQNISVTPGDRTSTTRSPQE